MYHFLVLKVALLAEFHSCRGTKNCTFFCEELHLCSSSVASSVYYFQDCDISQSGIKLQYTSKLSDGINYDDFSRNLKLSV
jgi:hypothetical protein